MQFGGYYLHKHQYSGIVMITPHMSTKQLHNAPPVEIMDHQLGHCMVGDQECQTWGQTSIALLGYYHPNIKQLIPREDVEFDYDKLKKLYMKKARNKALYPVFQYGDSKREIHGLSMLVKLFPTVDEDKVKDMFGITDRVTELIDKYNLYLIKEGENRMVMCNGVAMLYTQFKNYLREQKDGISNTTWIKLRDELLKRESYLQKS